MPAMGESVGVVLAGGSSSRMGQDKATLVVGGQTLAERAAATLARVCPEVVVADRGRGVVPGLRSVDDGPGQGPAAGLLGAARALPGRALLALACDLPAVPEALLAALAGGEAEWAAADLVIPRTRRGLEPLVARYGPRALAALEEQVAAGDYAPRHLLRRRELAGVVVEEHELARFGDPARFLANVNAPEDLARLLELGEDETGARPGGGVPRPPGGWERDRGRGG